MAPRINNIPIPNAMAYSGFYVPARNARSVRNGRGVLRPQGRPQVRWRWAQMSRDDYRWWTRTLLGGAESKEFTAAGSIELFNHEGVLTIYDECVVDAPNYERFQNGSFRNVEVLITQLKEA